MRHNEPNFEAMEITKTNTKMETKKERGEKRRDKKERGNRQRPQRLGLMSS